MNIWQKIINVCLAIITTLLIFNISNLSDEIKLLNIELEAIKLKCLNK